MSSFALLIAEFSTNLHDLKLPDNLETLERHWFAILQIIIGVLKVESTPWNSNITVAQEVSNVLQVYFTNLAGSFFHNDPVERYKHLLRYLYDVPIDQIQLSLSARMETAYSPSDTTNFRIHLRDKVYAFINDILSHYIMKNRNMLVIDKMEDAVAKVWFPFISSTQDEMQQEELESMKNKPEYNFGRELLFESVDTRLFEFNIMHDGLEVPSTIIDFAKKVLDHSHLKFQTPPTMNFELMEEEVTFFLGWNNLIWCHVHENEVEIREVVANVCKRRDVELDAEQVVLHLVDFINQHNL